VDVITGFAPAAAADVRGALSPEASIEARRSPGGPAPEAVERQLEAARSEIAEGREWLEARVLAPIYRAHREGTLLAAEIA
jgi:hypothetical protein